MSSSKAVLAVFLIIVAAISLLSSSSSSSSVLVSAGGSPWLRSVVSTCFSSSIPDEDLCYPTRCQHLFNRSSSIISPTPLNSSTGSYPWTYPTFRCVTETVYEYDSPTLNIPCKKARCECIAGPNNGQTCYPSDKLGCSDHSCPAS